MKFRLLSGALALLTSLVVAAAPASAAKVHRHKHRSKAHYYLALGDSLSVGYQPNTQGIGVETNQGYANLLATHYRHQVKNLRLVKLGCPGETTGSMITGRGNAAAVRAYRCEEPQLKKAILFLRHHHRRGEVPLVTVDIGANNVDGCVSQLSTLTSCLAKGERQIAKQLPKILKAIRRAAPKGTRFAAMNLYNPVLAYYLLPSDNPLSQLGEASAAFQRQVNAALAKADRQGHFKTADVARAFRSYDTAVTTVAGRQLPVNVAEICALTWICTAKPQGPNIHANAAGYAVIAKTFERAIHRL